MLSVSPVGSKSGARSAKRAILDSPTLEDAEAMLKRKIKAFTETNQAKWMEDNVREGLTDTPSPAACTRNPDE